MKISRGYKVELDPNNKQRTLFLQHAGVARFTYNWALNERIKLYVSEKKSISWMEQHKILNSLKATEFPWMYNSSKCAAQQAIRNCGNAFDNFFRNVKKGVNHGFPKFKSKHKSKTKFYLDGAIYILGNCIQLPCIGLVRLKETDYIPIDRKIKNVVISERAEHWFVAVNFEEEIPEQETTTEVAGIDLGINSLVHTSDNRIYKNPKTLKTFTNKLKRVQRELSRRTKGGKNRKKSQRKLARVHYKISCVRNDNLHKVTTSLVKIKPAVIVTEDLSLKNMMQNHCLAQALSDSSLGELQRQLSYKSEWNSILLYQIDRWFASSKICNCCGNKKEDLKLSDRIYRCDKCGAILDRDWNAAMNIRDYFLNEYDITASSVGINAHGQNVRREKHNESNRSLVEVRSQQKSIY